MNYIDCNKINKRFNFKKTEYKNYKSLEFYNCKEDIDDFSNKSYKDINFGLMFEKDGETYWVDSFFQFVVNKIPYVDDFVSTNIVDDANDFLIYDYEIIEIVDENDKKYNFEYDKNFIKFISNIAKELIDVLWYI